MFVSAKTKDGEIVLLNRDDVRRVWVGGDTIEAETMDGRRFDLYGSEDDYWHLWDTIVPASPGYSVLEVYEGEIWRIDIVAWSIGCTGDLGCIVVGTGLNDPLRDKPIETPRGSVIGSDGEQWSDAATWLKDQPATSGPASLKAG